MSNIIAISIEEYMASFEEAQREHLELGEPIPEINSSSLNKIKYILEVPFSKNFGKVAYWGFYSKAAILFYLMIKNHALSNGNKRMACYSLLLFYKINNREFKMSPEDLYKFTYLVVNSDSNQFSETIEVIKYTLRRNK